MYHCPVCGGEHVRYLGEVYGGGDYGTDACDEYECETCGTIWDEDCLDLFEANEDDETLST